MDLLKKELERKKKALARAKSQQHSTTSGGAGHCRFLKASELRRFEEEEEEEEQQQKEEKEKQPAKKKQRIDDDVDESSEEKIHPKKQPQTKGDEPEETNRARSSSLVATETKDTTTRRLRSMGLAVCLFGENDADRRERLCQAITDEQKNLASLSEKEEFRLGQEYRIRNPFLATKDEDPANSNKNSNTMMNEQQERQEAKKLSSSDKKKDESDFLNETDPHKRIYKYFKFLLKTWEEDLALRPDSVRRSVAGKNETLTFQQCQDYIRPLFKLCKKRNLEPGLTAHLTKIVNCCIQGEFVAAHDSYIDVAIGRAAWPIGVTMVGIHARTGRSKIESSNVAHVMNSELQRKYLTSVKRLMSYAQKKRTDVDPSKKVMN